MTSRVRRVQRCVWRDAQKSSKQRKKKYDFFHNQLRNNSSPPTDEETRSMKIINIVPSTSTAPSLRVPRKPQPSLVLSERWQKIYRP